MGSVDTLPPLHVLLPPLPPLCTIQEWMRNRAVVKAELAIELRGDLTKEEENLLRTQLREKEENTRKLQRANEESQKRMQTMEEAFMSIKQVKV